MTFFPNRPKDAVGVCPFCDQGFAGKDPCGEAMDCHLCDGHGWITTSGLRERQRQLDDLVGDAMVREACADTDWMLSKKDYLRRIEKRLVSFESLALVMLSVILFILTAVMWKVYQ